VSSRASFWIAVLLLLIAAALRLWMLASLPPGLTTDQLTDLGIAEQIRAGRIEVFYVFSTEGREGLYHTLLAALTAIMGSNITAYHLVSFWAGMLTLALVYALATRLYGPLPGVVALAVLVPNFSAILLSRGVGRETFLPLLVAAALLALARAFPVYQQNRRTRPPVTAPFVAFGLVLGLSFYTHPIGFLIALLSLAFIVYMVFSQQLPRLTINYTFFAVLIGLIIVTPYLISSLRNPDVSGFGRLFSPSANVVELLQNVWLALGGFFLYGDVNPVRNLPTRPLLDFVSGFLLVIGLVTSLRYWQLPRFALPLIALAALLPPALLARNAPDFSAFAALLPLVAVLVAAGFKTIYSSLHRRVQVVGIVGVVAVFCFNLYSITNDLFLRWRTLPAVQTAYHGEINALALYLDRTFDTMPTVVCTEGIGSGEAQPSPTPTQILLTMMHHESDGMRFVDCRFAMVFTQGGDWQRIAFPNPSVRREREMHSAIRQWLALGAEPNDPSVQNTVVMMNVETAMADTLGRFLTTTPVFYATEATTEFNSAQLPVRFGDNLTFSGYVRDDIPTYRPGNIITLVTYWRVDGDLPANLRLFTHLLVDPSATPAAQRDVLNVRPSELQQRDIFMQVTYIFLPDTLPAGEYDLSIGAYIDRPEPQTDERLAVLAEDQTPLAARLFLPQIVVER
jgi:4-amino-4-deoxy-L-arabinose transferase-like glycosyltransferase